MVTAVTKIDGDMTMEEKKEILQVFENEFHLSKRDAGGLLVSRTYRDDLESVLARSLDNFSPEQAESTIALVSRLGKLGGGETDLQLDFISKVNSLLAKTKSKYSVGPFSITHWVSTSLNRCAKG